MTLNRRTEDRYDDFAIEVIIAEMLMFVRGFPRRDSPTSRYCDLVGFQPFYGSLRRL